MGQIESGLAYYAQDYDQLWITTNFDKPNEGPILYANEIDEISIVSENI